MDEARWQDIDDIMVQGGKNLEKIGADFLIIASNTSHKSFNALQSAVSIPLLHIGEATAIALKKAGIKKVGLTGTVYTMKESHIKDIFETYGIDSIIPDDNNIKKIQKIIDKIDNLEKETLYETKKDFIQICSTLKNKGAEAVVLGCTELGILIKNGDFELPLFDTALIHSKFAAAYALS